MPEPLRCLFFGAAHGLHPLSTAGRKPILGEKIEGVSVCADGVSTLEREQEAASESTRETYRESEGGREEILKGIESKC